MFSNTCSYCYPCSLDIKLLDHLCSQHPFVLSKILLFILEIQTVHPFYDPTRKSKASESGTQRKSCKLQKVIHNFHGRYLLGYTPVPQLLLPSVQHPSFFPFPPNPFLFFLDTHYILVWPTNPRGAFGSIHARV